MPLNGKVLVRYKHSPFRCRGLFDDIDGERVPEDVNVCRLTAAGGDEYTAAGGDG